jgi:hypothetical protein
MPASVGMNQPVRMPPMMITGITMGSADPSAATKASTRRARFFRVSTVSGRVALRSGCPPELRRQRRQSTSTRAAGVSRNSWTTGVVVFADDRPVWQD